MSEAMNKTVPEAFGGQGYDLMRPSSPFRHVVELVPNDGDQMEQSCSMLLSSNGVSPAPSAGTPPRWPMEERAFMALLDDAMDEDSEDEFADLPELEVVSSDDDDDGQPSAAQPSPTPPPRRF